MSSGDWLGRLLCPCQRRCRHFRNVTSPLPIFVETLLDDGYMDMAAVMRALGRDTVAAGEKPAPEVLATWLPEESRARLAAVGLRELGDDASLDPASGLPREHFREIFEEAERGGSFGTSYFEKRLSVGLIHNKIGLEPRWYIGGYNFVLSQLVAVTVRQYRWKPAHLSEVLTALNCAVLLVGSSWIDLWRNGMAPSGSPISLSTLP